MSLIAAIVARWREVHVVGLVEGDEASFAGAYERMLVADITRFELVPSAMGATDLATAVTSTWVLATNGAGTRC